MIQITFTPLSQAHFSYMLKWLESLHVKKWWDQDIIYTMDLVKEKYGLYVDGYKQEGGINKSIHAYIINVNQEPAGYIQIYNANDFSRSKQLSDLPKNLGCIDIFIGEEKYLGQNIGSIAIKEFLNQYGTSYSHIFVDPDPNNIIAIKSYKKAGFYQHSRHEDTNEIWMLKEMSYKKLTHDIHFEKVTKAHENIIFSWLAESHIQEFWDNSKEHKDDILNFICNRPQTYFAGTTKYWIGYIDNEPYAFILSDILEKEQDDLTDVHLKYMSQTGHTVSLDFGIGSIKYLGQGLGAITLIEFMKFYRDNVDPKADTFFIDPDENNPRAVHVYSKAGFANVGQYDVSKGAFIGSKSELMVKKL